MLKLTNFDYSDQQFALYKMENIGDKIAMHEHDYSHLTVVVSGSVSVGNDNKRVELKEGQVINIPPNVEHEIVGLEPNSSVLNIVRK